MTKTQLKSIVKECLVELLAEGLNNTAAVATKRNRQNTGQKIRDEEQRLKEHRQKFEVRVEDTVSTITEDPIMQSILQDTARTTLQEQLSNELPTGQGGMEASSLGAGPGPGINLDSIFEGSSKNWGKLAFDE